MARVIEDSRSGLTSRLTGRAIFSRGEDGLILEEEGQLHMPGHPPMRAARRYLWADHGAGISVRFDDGRPFHVFDPSCVPCAAHHACPPDSYGVHYDFACWPRWQAVWHVRGPRKDYRMTTDYAR